MLIRQHNGSGSANARHVYVSSLVAHLGSIDVHKNGKGCEVCGGTHDTVPALHSSRKAVGGPVTVRYNAAVSPL